MFFAVYSRLFPLHSKRVFLAAGTQATLTLDANHVVVSKSRAVCCGLAVDIETRPPRAGVT